MSSVGLSFGAELWRLMLKITEMAGGYFILFLPSDCA